MDILKILGLKKETKSGAGKKDNPVPEDSKGTDQPVKSGGCCGSCGGQGHR